MTGIQATSLYAPYPPETEERLRISSVMHHMGFHLEYGELKYPLEYQGSVSLTFDENWAPYAQLSGGFKWVHEHAVNFLDPRLDAYVRVTAGYGWDYDKKYAYDMCRLHLRSATIQAPEMSVSLTAASSECLMQDQLWSLSSTAPVPTAGIPQALQWCLDAANIKGAFTPEVTGGTVTLPDQGVKQGANIWDLARDIAAGGKTWFYHDGLTGWRLRKRPVEESTPVLTLDTGPTGLVTGYEIGRDREQYADGVIVRHQFHTGVDRDRKDIEIVGRAMSGTPKRWKLIERQTAITEAGAREEAETLLKRYMDKRRQVSITAKAAYWLRPGHTVAVDIPGVKQAGRVSRVQYSFPAGRMSVRIVLPESEGE